MKASQLRSSILQQAVEGKLVPQRPEEGTAADLLESIRAEREALIKAGKIKKAKPLPEITEEEIPFEIPKSWEWVRLGSIVNIVSARRVHQNDWKTEGIPFYRAREIVKLADFGFVDNELYISQELYEKYSESGVPKPGDLMVSGVGTLGKTYVVKEEDCFYYKDASVLCFENFGKLNPEYLKRLMESSYMLKLIYDKSAGTTVDTITIEKANSYFIPLPPLAEQKRIVAKLEELMPLIDAYEKEEEKLSALEKSLPEKLRRSVLQQAVEGKLVPQRAEEGTAAELLKEIEKERAGLIKAGKMKKAKPLPEISEEEIPFEIPKSWEWVRLGDITINRDGERIPLSLDERQKLEKIYDYYGASGVIDKVDRYLFNKRLLLIGEDGANLITRSKPIAFFAEGKYWVNNHAHVLDTGKFINLDYIALYINSTSLITYIIIIIGFRQCFCRL